MRFLNILCFSCSSMCLVAQEVHDIRFFADVMINAADPNHRYLAHISFEKMANELMNSENSWYIQTRDIEFISTVYAPDSAFRFITWTIDLGEGNFEYFGYFQEKENQAIRLAKKRGQLGLTESGSIPISNWPAGLVYRIEKVNTTDYLIMTYRQTDLYTKHKILDVFELRSRTMGADARFPDKDGSNAKHRLKLSYSADSNAGFNYNPEMKMITFDNLVEMPGQLPNQGLTLVSDGSYRVYVLDDQNSWMYRDKLFEGPAPKLTDVPKPTDDRDVLKNKRKKN